MCGAVRAGHRRVGTTRLTSVGDSGELTLGLPFFLFVPGNLGLRAFVGIVNKTDLLFLRCAGNKRARRGEQENACDLSL